MKQGKKIIVAGGGTGGHIFPAIAIANALKRLDSSTEILFVGAKGKMEMEKVPQAGFQIEGLTIAGFNRSSLLKNISLPFKLMKSFSQVAGIFKRFKPDAVIGVGGYSSFPVLRYAQWKGVPSFIHEANSFGGKSNVLLSKKANVVFTATDGMERFFPAQKIVVTGNPVRQEIVEINVSKEEGCKYFKLNGDGLTVLCVGGSLGARGINEAIDAGLDKLIENGIQVIWQTGTPYRELAEKRIIGRKGVYAAAFIQNMEYAYAASDVVVSRSGAMTIAELCVVKKAAILVPFPFAAEDHQTANAQNLVQKNAAIMIKDDEAKDKLINEIIELAKNENKRTILINNIKQLAIFDADVQIAKEILKTLN